MNLFETFQTKTREQTLYTNPFRSVVAFFAFEFFKQMVKFILKIKYKITLDIYFKIIINLLTSLVRKLYLLKLLSPQQHLFSKTIKKQTSLIKIIKNYKDLGS